MLSINHLKIMCFRCSVCRLSSAQGHISDQPRHECGKQLNLAKSRSQDKPTCNTTQVPRRCSCLTEWEVPLPLVTSKPCCWLISTQYIQYSHYNCPVHSNFASLHIFRALHTHNPALCSSSTATCVNVSILGLHTWTGYSICIRSVGQRTLKAGSAHHLTPQSLKKG